MRYDEDIQGWHTGYMSPTFGSKYDLGFRPGWGQRRAAWARPRVRYGEDYWWIGEHEMNRRHPAHAYDERYHRFSERTHPRFSPVGGMYPEAGNGWYAADLPRPLRENRRFSDWTRWF